MINKIDKLVTRLTKKKRVQTNKIRNEIGDITMTPQKYKGL
jgi:hypothetical protein